MSGEDVLLHQHKTWSHIDCNGHCVSAKKRNMLWWTTAAVFILNLHMIRVLFSLYYQLNALSGYYHYIFYPVTAIWGYLFMLGLFYNIHFISLFISFNLFSQRFLLCFSLLSLTLEFFLKLIIWNVRQLVCL